MNIKDKRWCSTHKEVHPEGTSFTICEFPNDLEKARKEKEKRKYETKQRWKENHERESKEKASHRAGYWDVPNDPRIDGFQ